MVVYTSGPWLQGTALLFLALIYMLYLRIKNFTKKEAMFLVLGIVVGAILFLLEHQNIYVIFGLEVGIFTFNGLLNTKSPKWRTYYVSASILYITLLHWVGFTLLAQAMLIGLLSSITNIKEYKNNVENKQLEVKRDVVHILMGIILSAMFYFQSTPVAISILMIVILGGILAISIGEMYKDGKFHNIMFRLERNGTNLGHGALWLALGTLLVVSFLGSREILAVFAAIFFGDPIATIVGVNVRGARLPYNSKKSIAGTFAYFATTSIVAWPFVGAYALAVGLVGAFVESIKTRIDDNFSVALVLVALALILNV